MKTILTLLALIGVIATALGQTAKVSATGSLQFEAGTKGQLVRNADLTFSIEMEANQPQPKIDALIAYLKDIGIYTFADGWDGISGLSKLPAGQAPFAPDVATPVEVKSSAAFPNQLNVKIHGAYAEYARGTVTLAQPPESVGWKLESKSPSVGKPVVLLNAYQPNLSVPTFKPNFEFDGKNLVFSFTSGGQLGAFKHKVRDGKIVGTRGWTFDANGTLPLEVPEDVRGTSGSSRDASGQVPDFLSLTISSYGYESKLGMNRFGFRARATGEAKGVETSAYYQPFWIWTKDNRADFAAEIELGYRDGDAEWETLTTHAPDRGHQVARLGLIAEYAPRIGDINKDLSTGMRFFIRLRGWADGFDGETKDYTFRFRHFADAELFYNISKTYRVFLRGEHGYLPPDLSRETKRIFIGIGGSF